MLPSSTFSEIKRGIPTIDAGDFGPGRIVQVTKQGVLLIDLVSQAVLASWNAEAEIVCSAVENEVVLVAMRGGRVVNLKIEAQSSASEFE